MFTKKRNFGGFFLFLKIAVQIGLYVNINVNIKGPTFVSFHLSRVRECGK